jgi:hypothetical protein
MPEAKIIYPKPNPKPLSEARYKIGQLVWFINQDEEIEELTIIRCYIDNWNIYYRCHGHNGLFPECWLYSTLDEFNSKKRDFNSLKRYFHDF